MRWLWNLLNSRKAAVYLLLAVIVVLVASTLLPSGMTLTQEGMTGLRNERPFVFWLSENFSTQRVVVQPLFVVISVFLFMSTLACTITRIKKWLNQRKLEFEKEKAFSFRTEATSGHALKDTAEKLLGKLQIKGWDCNRQGDTITAQRGLGLGFWGSVVFHSGLVICFLAVPVTSLTLFRADIILTEGLPVLFHESLVSSEGGAMAPINDLNVGVHDLWGIYSSGIYKVDFGGKLKIDGSEYNFGVNRPVSFRGYKLELAKYGYSTNIVIEKDGQTIFDYFLNLFNRQEGDYFDFNPEGMDGEDMRILVLFFPDYYREGGVLKSRTEEPNNPFVLVRFFRQDRPVHKGLIIKAGDEDEFEGYKVKFPEFRNWVGFIVVKEWGMPLLGAGFLVGIVGLFVRFLSNERRLEIEIRDEGSNCTVMISGYSRYYPAFLEREVTGMAMELEGDR